MFGSFKLKFRIKIAAILKVFVKRLTNLFKLILNTGENAVNSL